MDGLSDTSNNVKLLNMQRTTLECTLPPIDEIPTSPPTPPDPLLPPTAEFEPSSAEEENEATTLKDSTAERGNTIPRTFKYRRQIRNSIPHILSYLYAKLIIIAVLILIATELLHNKIPLFFYHGYLFSFIVGGGILFLFFVYLGLISGSCCTSDTSSSAESVNSKFSTRRAFLRTPDCSIYARIMVLFLGLGSLVSVALEIGVMFTMKDGCLENLLQKVQPILLTVFTLAQMHVLFMDSEKVVSSLGCFRHFSLMHLLAANIGIWIRVVLWDTARDWLQDIHVVYNSSTPWPPPGINKTVHSVDMRGQHRVHFTTSCWWSEYPEGRHVEDYWQYHSCVENSTVGMIWGKALPYLSPLILQYALAAAALLYALWVGPSHRAKRIDKKYPTPASTLERKSLKHQSHRSGSKLDCRGSTKGLFLGMVVLIFGVIMMILFFVLFGNNQLGKDTLFIISIVYSSVLGVTCLAFLIGLLQIQQMCSTIFDQWPPHQIIQSFGTVAVMIYGTLNIIVGIMKIHDNAFMLLLINGAIQICHTSLQTLFINRLAFKNCPSDCSHQKYRPGRQIVMFLVFTNLVLWLMDTFMIQHQVSTTIQSDFYGHIPWSLMNRIIAPVIMLYRLHSSVLFADAWKDAYRV